MASLINKKQCINCEATCTVTAISEIAGIRYIDPIKCSNCGEHSPGSPVNAITPGDTPDSVLLRKIH